MKKNYYLFLLLLLLILPYNIHCNIQSSSFSYLHYESASVLPFYTKHNTKYAILMKERFGKDEGTYGDFYARRGNEEKHPVETAARAFWQQAILDKTICFNLLQTENYIDINRSDNTEYIIVDDSIEDAKNITYITDFTKYKSKFINKFYNARSSSYKHSNKEKNRIALVNWDDLKDAIADQRSYDDCVYVKAFVINPRTNRKEREKILLRPCFVTKLYEFFAEGPFISGKNKKIRFYESDEVI